MIKHLRGLEINSIYDFDNAFSINELLCKFWEKIEETIKISNESIDILNWIKEEGLPNEVQILINQLVADGTIEQMINVNKIEELRTLITDKNTEVINKITEVNKQLETKANKIDVDNRRVFLPRFYGNLNWSSSYPVNDGKYLKVDETLSSWLNCCDGIILDFQILPNGSISDDSTYHLNPSISWLNYVIDKCKELNINIKGVKFHANEIRDNASSLTFNNWFSKYKNIINEVIQVLKCEYVLLFNESPGLLNRTPTEVLTINNYVEHLKNLGFKVGFGGVGLPSYLTTLNYNFDVISYHAYPVISGKMLKTTLEDSLIAWEENATVRNLLNARVKYPNKEIMLGEAGCSNYWECLSNPEKWDWDWSTLTKDESGKVSALFLYGMFEKLKNSDIDCVCFWYNDPMLEQTQKLVKKYL